MSWPRTDSQSITSPSSLLSYTLLRRFHESSDVRIDEMTKEDSRAIQNKLKELRKSSGFLREQIARLLGVKPSTINFHENDDYKTGKFSTLNERAISLGYKLTWKLEPLDAVWKEDAFHVNAKRIIDWLTTTNRRPIWDRGLGMYRWLFGNPNMSSACLPIQVFRLLDTKYLRELKYNKSRPVPEFVTEYADFLAGDYINDAFFVLIRALSNNLIIDIENLCAIGQYCSNCGTYDDRRTGSHLMKCSACDKEICGKCSHLRHTSIVCFDCQK